MFVPEWDSSLIGLHQWLQGEFGDVRCRSVADSDFSLIPVRNLANTHHRLSIPVRHFRDRRWLLILGKPRVREPRLLPALQPSPSTGDDSDHASGTSIHKVRPDDVCDALHDQDDVDEQQDRQD